jgi:ABC-type transport system involved in multi-copper enzyme maturation permease subunit
MLRHLLGFELAQLLKNGVFWIVVAVYALMGFGTIASDDVTIGGGVGNIMRNAPAVVISLLGSFSVISVLLATIFVAGIAIRDFEQRTAELFFATPMKKRDYLLGRYGGGMIATFAIMLAMAIGLYVGSLMPWLDSSRLGPTPWLAYAWAFGVLVLPNLLFVSSLMFLLATLTRSMLYTYLGVIVFFVLWSMSGSFTSDLESRWIGALVDPSGGAAVAEHIRYWSSAQFNSQLPELTGLLLGNRALWLGIAIVMLLAAFHLFRTDREGIVLRRRKAPQAAPEAEEGVRNAPPSPVSLRSDWRAQWRQYLHQSWFDLRNSLRGAPFIVMVVLGLLLTFTVIKFSGLIYGTQTLPVTAQMLDMINGGMSLFLIIIITFYAGEMVWRERSMRVAEATDAYTAPDWVPLAAKMTALSGLVAVVLVACALFTIGYQLFDGYGNIEPLLYAKGLLLQFLPFVMMAALAVFFQVVTGNMFVGYVLMIAYLVTRVVMGMYDFDHALYNYGKASPTPYSDMNGYGHFIGPWLWFRAYWGAFALLLLGIATALWPRGTSLAWKDRLKAAKLRLRSTPLRATLAVALLAFVGLGGWIYYNTNVLNEYVPGDQAKQRQADYEKAYRKYIDLPQPRITDIRADVDIHPEARSVEVRGRYRLENLTSKPIADLHVTLNPELDDIRYDFPAHKLVQSDPVSGYRIYRLEAPLAPGATMDFEFGYASRPQGFPLNGGDTAVVYNGTFFNNGAALPQLGYQAGYQLQDRNDRKKYGLPELPRMPPIDDRAEWNNNYISGSADWVNFETTISTSAGQVALAPGYLQREWTKDGRRYFHYKSEARLLPFFSWLSADWKVKRDRWNDVALEVYYDAKHPYNVERMVESAKKSLDYYTREFSPYQFRQLRILEFPGYSKFAQAFAGTVPYSESIGFIADLRDKEKIDYVFYVTAHEVAHQWWAHQVVGANVQGATMLSESLAQYSALMVMEHEYGPQKMRKFLRHELDSYLTSRATERVRELPLALNENQQYIHYNKGSVVFYALKDAIGEEAFNRILAGFLDKWAFKGPPYPTTRDFMADLYAGTDPKFHPLIRDLFERIVFFDNRAVEATATKRPDGRYALTLKVHSAKLVADGKGKEAEEDMDELVDIGVFTRPPGGDEEDEKVLYLRKHHITGTDNTIELVVDGEPYEAGIDPYNKLVDRSSGDNRKRVTVQ